MKKTLFTYCIVWIIALCCDGTTAHAQVLKDLPAYRCVRYEQNALLFPGERTRQDHFYRRLDSLLLFNTGNVNIWHVGGSHVQADIFSHRLRSNLSELQPDVVGNRGILFPYPIARTNYSHNYRIRYTGRWTTGKNTKKDQPYLLGITGMAACTNDSTASITVHLNTNQQNTQWQFDQLNILGYADSVDTYPYLLWENDTLIAHYDSLYHYYNLTLPTPADSVTIYWHLQNNDRFTITGIFPQNQQQGISYYSSGVNGAALPAWLRCTNLKQDLSLIHPHLAIFAVGINDAAVPAGAFNVEAFKSNYRQLIEQVLSVSPNCALLFITNNDSYRYVSRRKMSANTNGPIVKRAFYELAQEYNGCVWDLFSIMGGMGSVNAWEEEQLVRHDRLHFTTLGYELLGDMLYNAILTDYLTNP